MQPLNQLKALIILAHGSRREASNQEVATLAERLRDQLPEFDLLGHAFLELARPGINKTASDLITAGATRITVLPYFLVAGRHVVEDIPAQIAALDVSYPGTKITLLEYIGASTAMDGLLIDQVRKTSRPD